MIGAALESTGVIAIIRGIEGDALDRTMDALIDGGIQLAEITMNTAGAAKSIARLREKYDGVIYVGAGTVTNKNRAAEALSAGAQFVIAPNTDVGVIRMCLERDILIAPGAFTPTEVLTAMNYGCEYVKLFPAHRLGEGYVKDLLGPIDNVKLIAVGGIGVENASAYIRSGVVGVGVGDSLCRAATDGNYNSVFQMAARLIEVCGNHSRLFAGK